MLPFLLLLTIVGHASVDAGRQQVACVMKCGENKPSRMHIVLSHRNSSTSYSVTSDRRIKLYENMVETPETHDLYPRLGLFFIHINLLNLVEYLTVRT